MKNSMNPRGLSKKRPNVFASALEDRDGKGMDRCRDVQEIASLEATMLFKGAPKEKTGDDGPGEKRTWLDDVLEYKSRHPTLEDELAHLPDVNNDHMTDEQIHQFAVTLAGRWGYRMIDEGDDAGGMEEARMQAWMRQSRPPGLGVGADVPDSQGQGLQESESSLIPRKDQLLSLDDDGMGTQRILIGEGRHAGLTGHVVSSSTSWPSALLQVVRLDVSRADVFVPAACCIRMIANDDGDAPPSSVESHFESQPDISRTIDPELVKPHMLLRVLDRQWLQARRYWHVLHVLDVLSEPPRSAMIVAKDVQTRELVEVPQSVRLGPMEPTEEGQTVVYIHSDLSSEKDSACHEKDDSAIDEEDDDWLDEEGTVVYLDSDQAIKEHDAYLVTVQMHRDGSLRTRPASHWCCKLVH